MSAIIDLLAYHHPKKLNEVNFRSKIIFNKILEIIFRPQDRIKWSKKQLTQAEFLKIICVFVLKSRIPAFSICSLLEESEWSRHYVYGPSKFLCLCAGQTEEFSSACSAILPRWYTSSLLQLRISLCLNQGGGIHGVAPRAEHGTISGWCSVVYIRKY